MTIAWLEEFSVDMVFYYYLQACYKFLPIESTCCAKYTLKITCFLIYWLVKFSSIKKSNTNLPTYSSTDCKMVLIT